MKQVIVFPRGQLTADDKAELAVADIVAVEADDPSKVVTVLPGAPLASADAMLMAAMHGIAQDTTGVTKRAFFNSLHERMKFAEATKETTS